MNAVVDTVTQVTDTLDNAATGAGNTATGAAACVVDIVVIFAETPAALIPAFVVIANLVVCVGEAALTTGTSTGPGTLRTLGFNGAADELEAIDNFPLTRALMVISVAMLAVVAAVVALAATEGTASISMVADILQAVGQIVVAIGRMEVESSEKSVESLRLGLRLVDQGIKRMVQGVGQQQASKGDDERRARANAAYLQMSLQTLAGKLSHLKPKQPPHSQHIATAVEHSRKLRLATGKLTLVMGRRHGANPRAAQAIAALQRLQGNFHVTRTKLLEARKAALRMQSKQTAGLTPGFQKPVLGGFGRRS
ncbi:MAG: hypothetical protein ABSD71_15675 [Bacteroidales bacterium]